MIQPLLGNVSLVTTPEGRYLCQAGHRIRVPMRVAIYAHHARCISLVYRGRHKRHCKSLAATTDVLARFQTWLQYLLEVDELYEHPITMKMLYRRSVPGHEHFVRCDGVDVEVYMADGKRLYVGGSKDPDSYDLANRVALDVRKDILATRWTAVTPIEPIPG